MMLLSEEQKRYGVLSASSGNHGNALNYTAGVAGVPSLVVMPTNSSITKRNNAERNNGQVLLHGKNMAEAKRYAMALAKERKMMYVNG